MSDDNVTPPAPLETPPVAPPAPAAPPTPPPPPVHEPILKAEDVEINVPEGMELDQDEAEWFRKTVVAMGLSKAQAKAFLDGHMEFARTVTQNQRVSAEKSLRAEFGQDYDAKIARAEDASKKFNELSNGALSRILAQGLGNDPEFIKFMSVIGEAVSDSAWPGAPSGGGGDAAMSSVDFIKQQFNMKGA